MDVMATYPDGYFDLAVVDPPYGIGASRPSKKPNNPMQSNGKRLMVKDSGYTHKDWDDSVPDECYFYELLRVSKEQIIWGVNYFDFPLPGGRIVWNKLNEGSDQYDCEIAYKSMSKSCDLVHYLWRGMFQGEVVSKDPVVARRQIGNKSLNEKRIHPTQKPVKLYSWLYTEYAPSFPKIIDTHMGSMSSAIAAHLFGAAEFIGCEIDEEYFDNGVNRVRAETAQMQIPL